MPSSPQTITTRRVFDYLKDPANNALANRTVNCVLNFNGASVTSPVVNLGELQQSTTTDSNGYWSFLVAPNDTITPSGTLYRIQTDFNSYDISVPSGGADVQSSSILANVPAVLSPALTGLTGPITVTGNETITGILTVQGTTALQGAITTDITANGNVIMHGPDPWYDVKNFGAAGNGSTDDRVSIQSALTAARTAGGGIVYFPPGTYLVSSVVHPNDSGFNAALVVGAKTVVLGAGRDATTIKLANSQTGANNMVLANFNVLAGGDEQITLQDFSVDGNAANQTPTGLNEGIAIRRARGVRFLRVRSFNNWGTDLTTHEGADFNVLWSTDVSYTDCECPNTAASTSAGFAASYTTNLKYANCLSFGSGHGIGFTHFFCRQVQHVNCHSYLNNQHGFNSEQSDGVVWVDCIAGGQAATQQPAQNPNYPYATNLSLGNGQHGFIVRQDTQGIRARLVECISRNNGGDGLLGNASVGLRVVSGDFSGNGQNGLHIGATDTDWYLKPAPMATGNTTTALRLEARAGDGSGGLGYNIANLTSGANTAPAMPASATQFFNPFGLDMLVALWSGTVSQIAIDNNNIGVSPPMMYRLSGGSNSIAGRSSITITYTVAPTWIWFAD